jgi:hypothetical protein
MNDVAGFLNIEPQTIFILGIAIVAWIAMFGLSLQLAFKVVGANPQGYFSCLGYALLLPTINGLISTVAYSTIGAAFGLVGILQLYIQIKILKIAGDCGGWRAFFSGIVHGIFASIGTVAIIMVLFFSGSIDPEQIEGPLKELVEKAKEERMSGGHARQPATSGSLMSFGGSQTADGAQTNPFFDQE